MKRTVFIPRKPHLPRKMNGQNAYYREQSTKDGTDASRITTVLLFTHLVRTDVASTHTRTALNALRQRPDLFRQEVKKWARDAETSIFRFNANMNIEMNRVQNAVDAYDEFCNRYEEAARPNTDKIRESARAMFAEVTGEDDAELLSLLFVAQAMQAIAHNTTKQFREEFGNGYAFMDALFEAFNTNTARVNLDAIIKRLTARYPQATLAAAYKSRDDIKQAVNDIVTLFTDVEFLNKSINETFEK